MINDKIYQLARQADMIEFDSIPGTAAVTPSYESIAKARKFAELIVKECAENLTKVWYEQGMDIRGAEIGKFLTRFNEHFGVEE